MSNAYKIFKTEPVTYVVIIIITIISKKATIVRIAILEENKLR